MAHWLKDRGFEAYAIVGGVAALENGHTAPVLIDAPGADVSASVVRSRPLAALRHRRFRLFSTGVLLSLTGNWVEAAAFGYVVLLLGGSPAALGVIGFLNTIPNLMWGLPAGVSRRPL